CALPISRGDEEHVLEDDPAGVFEPAPFGAAEHAVYRLRPEETPDQMVHRDYRRGRDQHPPVAVKGQEGQGAEDVEMTLDAAAGQVNEQGSEEHLAGGDAMPGQ